MSKTRTGIFGGPNALGILEATGAVDVPWYCWDQPNFKANSDACFAAAQQGCDGNQSCINELVDKCMTQFVAVCEKNKGTTGTAGKPSCASKVSAVQSALKVSVNSNLVVDGKWGPKSQQALEESGLSFETVAGGCTPPVPTAKAATKKDAIKPPTPQSAPPKTTKTVAPPAAYKKPPVKAAGMSTTTMFLLAVGVVAVGAVAYKYKKKGQTGGSKSGG